MRDPWFFQRWAFEQTTGSATRKAVLTTLAIMADTNTGRAEPKVVTIATSAEMSDKTVRNALKSLADDGFIARREQRRADGGRRGDEYLLLADGVTEWPDGTPAVSRTGGPPSPDVPAPPVPPTGALPPAGTAQERPVGTASGNSSSSSPSDGLFVGDEIERDAAVLLDRKTKVDGKLVTVHELTCAAAAIREWNAQAGQSLGLGSNLKQIVMRARERPNWGPGEFERLIQSAWRLRWWESAPQRGPRRRPGLGVVFGPNAFEAVIQDAADEKNGTLDANRPPEPGRFDVAPDREELL